MFNKNLLIFPPPAQTGRFVYYYDHAPNTKKGPIWESDMKLQDT